MFEEAQVYSPITKSSDGGVEVELGTDHPGVSDPEYRRRRNHIAQAAIEWTRGEPTPTISYTDDEHRVWATISKELSPLHEELACQDFLDGKAALKLPEDRVPQLAEVSELLKPITGWTYAAAPGLVPLREFYAALGERLFHSTQYMRHSSQPLYTPEPDVVHEVVGHANQLASERFARLTAAAGAATTRLENDDAVKFVADVFWFSMEFGVLKENDEIKAYGAGILSSFGEMQEFRSMELEPLNLKYMGTLDYDITKYQPVLFVADSAQQIDDVVGEFFDTVDDDLALSMGAGKRLPRAEAKAFAGLA